jgi:NTE family protein
MRELGLDYQIVTGTSIGALNAALMAQGDYEAAVELWRSLETGQVIAVRPGREKLERLEGGRVLEFVGDMARFGGTDTPLLEKILTDVVDEPRLRESPVEFGLVTTRFPSLLSTQLTKAEIPEGRLIDYILASACYYPVFQSKNIDGQGFIDGAYSDNVPGRLALQCGAEEIIAVDLNSSGSVPRLRTGIPVTLITSAWNLGPTLHFSPPAALRGIALGRLYTLRAFRRAEGVFYAFAPGEARRNAERLLPALRQISLRSGVDVIKSFAHLHPASAAVKARERRFHGNRSQPPASFGKKLCFAAEIAGELLGLPPDRLYAFEEYNALLVENTSFMAAADSTASKRRQRKAKLGDLYALLLQTCREGRRPDFFSERILPFRRAYFAAAYLLALAVSEGRAPMGL